MNKPSAQQIRSWIHRQRTLGTPSPAYLKWLRTQYRLTCVATVIAASSVTGCAQMNHSSGWHRGGQLLGIESAAQPNVSSYSSRITTVQLPNGSYQVQSTGSSISVIQTSRTK